MWLTRTRYQLRLKSPSKNPNLNQNTKRIPNQMNYPKSWCWRSRYFMRNGTCLNGSACCFSHEVIQGRHSNGPSPRPRREKRLASLGTMLRRLLETEMRRESTMTLQLSRYIADCNYFQKPSPVIESAEELVWPQVINFDFNHPTRLCLEGHRAAWNGRSLALIRFLYGSSRLGIHQLSVEFWIEHLM